MRTWPEVVRSIPAATCSSVVFPYPDGPITAVNSPDAERNGHPVQGRDRAGTLAADL